MWMIISIMLINRAVLIVSDYNLLWLDNKTLRRDLFLIIINWLLIFYL